MHNDTNILTAGSFKEMITRIFVAFIFILMLPYNKAVSQTTTIDNGALVTIAASAVATTPGNITINAGGGVNNSGSLQLQGNWINNGSFTDVGGTVTFNSVTTGKTISGLLTGVNKFNNIIFNGIGGAWVFNNDAEAGGNIFFTNGTVTAPAGILTLDGNLTQTVGSFLHNDGLVLFKGIAAQSYTAATPLVFFSVTNNNSAGLPGLSINSDLTILKELKLLSLSKFNLVSGNVTLQSTVANTANVAAVPAETDIIKYGTGRFVMERYINTGTGAGQHGKSWQFLAAPTIGQTIHESWMENAAANANPNPGYGTQIPGTTGTAGGFDVASSASSIQTYLPATDTWAQATNPNTTSINNSQGYMLFVRGDRSVINFSGANSAALSTTMRTRGTLQTGPLSSLTVTAGKFQSVGNPYPSAIDFSSIVRTGGVDPNFYLYDPTLYGSRGLGGYQTIAAATGYLATPGNFSTTSTLYNTTSDYRNIQSGEAFFVRATGTNGTMNFDESNKVSTSSLANRIAGIPNRLSMLSTNLLVENGTLLELADGNKVVFDNKFNNLVDAYDARKVVNKGENFGLSRNGASLAVEARKKIITADTIWYNMASLRQLPYRLMFIPQNIASNNLKATLIDHFLNARTTISLTDTSYIAIAVTTDLASKAADRFILVFESTRYTTPLILTGIDSKKAQPVAIKNNISVYPNPVADHMLSIQFDDQPPGRYRYRITDVNGRDIQHGVLGVTGKRSETILRLNSFIASGSYRLIITDGNGKLVNCMVVVD